MSQAEEADVLRATAGVTVLADTRVVRVGGEDARTWLQGQITNDVLLLPEGGSCYALLLDAHGKVECDLFVFRRSDDLLLLLPRAKSDEVLARLDRYVVMEDVELEPLDHLAVLSVQGPRAAEVKADDPDVFAADRLGLGGFDRVIDRSGLEEARRAWIERARALGGGEVGSEGLELARVRAGRAALGREVGAHTLPQEAGLGAIAVSFRKGCYVGQEPVVMLEHRGKPPKRLVRATVPPALVGETPRPLTSEGQEVATLTSAVLDPESPTGASGLALVRRAWATVGGRLDSPSGEVRILDLVENRG